MAYYFDEFGQYVEYETEEERKRREDFDNTAVQTQEIKTYGDGTVEKITKEEMPGDYAPAIQDVAVQPVQQMPVQQPVAPVMSLNDNLSGSQRQYLQRMDDEYFKTKVSAVPPDYNANIARQESGNRPGIGFHDQSKSSAYGTYGLTNAAYADARKLNPNLPEDIRQATPEQQTAAQTAFTQQNAGYLQKLGIDPTPNNLAAAHFLGAQGLSNYLRDGSISEAAARANGGADNVRRIVQQRLGGQAAPASAAAPAMAQPAQAAATEAVSPYSLATGQSGLGIQTGTAPVTEPARQYIDNYQSIQDDPMKLMALRSDENAPAFIRERAGEQAYALMNREVQTATATKQAQDLAQRAAAGDRRASNTIARELQNQDGSWLKFILLSYISPSMAAEEAIKLGYGNQWTTTTDAEGKSALIQFNAKGLPLKGYTADGAEIDSNDLVRAAAGGGKKDLDIVGGTFVNDKTGEVGRMVTDKRTGKTQVQTDSGLKPMTGFRPQSSTGTLEDQRTRTIQDINLKLRGKGVEESMAILRDYNQKLVGAGYAPVQPGEVGINVPQISGGTAAAPAQGQSAAAAAAAGSGGKITPLPTTQAAPAGQAIQPTPLPAGTAAAPAGTRPTMTQLEAAGIVSKETAEDLAKTKVNQGRVESNADYLITKIDELFMDEKAFKDSVGIKGAGLLFGAKSEPFSGTKEADWMARFEEVKGQSFLQAIETLRGMGALSNTEGQTATKAIQKMSQTQSEDEFRKAAEDFQNVIRRGVDRSRRKLGQEPLYGTPAESELSKNRRNPQAPEVGTEKDGWIFQGGNPADKKNWKKK